jgi:regulator of cell morphogenesis and NO signaling
MFEIYRETAIGDVVAHDLRTAVVFNRFGIDFCCGGRRTVEDACVAAHLDPDRVISDLRAVHEDPESAGDLTVWPATRLIDRIVSRHHAYVRAQTPVIKGYLARLVAKHSHRHVEVARLAAIFADVSDELLRHMDKEERILFPAIAALADDYARGTAPDAFGRSIHQPIAAMEDEHEWAGAQLTLMRTLSHDYAVPQDGCATWRACYAALEDFEKDLHQHVHLENNVLFPLARRLGEALKTTA